MRVLICALALLLVSCTKGDEVTQILLNQGYTEIQMTGYKWLSCSEDDVFHTGFTAKNQMGKTVSGTVCGGFLKGYTIRFD